MKLSEKEITELHDEAMMFAEEGEECKILEPNKAIKRFTAAFKLEKQAAEALSEDCEPSRSTMYYSAMCLASDAKLYSDASEIAKTLLSFTKFEEYRIAAKDILNLY